MDSRLCINLIAFFQGDGGLTRLHHHVTGVLSHSRKKSYAFTWTDKFVSNCNVTLNCMMAVLEDIAKVCLLLKLWKGD